MNKTEQIYNHKNESQFLQPTSNAKAAYSSYMKL